MPKDMSTDKIEITIEIIKVVALSAFLIFACSDAEFPDVLWKPAGILFKAAIIGLSYFAGSHFSGVYKEGGKNYLLIFYGIGIITLIAWAGLGIHDEGGDFLFGDGATVVDFVPTKIERANHAITIFLSLIIPAFYGMYKKRKS